MEEDKRNQLYGKDVLDFVTVATEYTTMLDSLHEYSQYGFIKYTLKLLPLLYMKAHLLPDFEIEEPETIEKFVSEEEWSRVKLQLEQLIGELDNYKENIGRFEENEINSLSENFADIYQDIKDFNNLYATSVDEFMRDAVAEVKRTFKEYWGQRLVNTLRIMHHYYFSKTLSRDSEREIDNNTDEWIIEQRKNEWEIE
ncbi:MAG: DUF5063 domain-containing protein [Salinivirgaceae bacterium]|jgi:hypothetical protein|nr:DUF5063 domain-containing protein [Salinivirgaceae bacterium]